jgi:hypothetical protein
MMAGRNGSFDREAVAELIAITPSHAPYAGSSGATEEQRHELRRLLGQLAGSIGLDLAQPPLPRFEEGEETIAAAARVLTMTHVLEALKANGARRRLLAQARAEVNGWRRELRELQLDELVRRQDALDEAGRLPGFPPQKPAARAGDLFNALLLVDAMPGGAHAGRDVVPAEEPDLAVILAAFRPGDYLPALLFTIAITDRLAVLAEAHREGNRIRARAGLAAAAAKRLAVLALDKSDNRELARTLPAAATWARPFSKVGDVIDEALARDIEPAAS